MRTLATLIGECERLFDLRAHYLHIQYQMVDASLKQQQQQQQQQKTPTNSAKRSSNNVSVSQFLLTVRDAGTQDTCQIKCDMRVTCGSVLRRACAQFKRPALFNLGLFETMTTSTSTIERVLPVARRIVDCLSTEAWPRRATHSSSFGLVVKECELAMARHFLDAEAARAVELPRRVRARRARPIQRVKS